MGGGGLFGNQRIKIILIKPGQEKEDHGNKKIVKLKHVCVRIG